MLSIIAKLLLLMIGLVFVVEVDKSETTVEAKRLGYNWIFYIMLLMFISWL